MLQRTKGVPEALIPDCIPLGIRRQAAEGEGEAGVPMLADCLLLALPGLYSLGSQDSKRSREESRTGMFFIAVCGAWVCGLYVTKRC